MSVFLSLKSSPLKLMRLLKKNSFIFFIDELFSFFFFYVLHDLLISKDTFEGIFSWNKFFRYLFSVILDLKGIYPLFLILVTPHHSINNSTFLCLKSIFNY
jgi:hypothetical protein